MRNPLNQCIVEHRYHSLFACFMNSLGQTNKRLIEQLGIPFNNIIDNINNDVFAEYLPPNSILQRGYRDLGYFYEDPNTLPARYPIADYRHSSIKNFLVDKWGSISRFTDENLKRKAENIVSGFFFSPIFLTVF